MLVEGQVLEGKYAVSRRIADGGMSAVYLAVNERIGKRVAIKVLHPRLAREDDVQSRFEREARIVSCIRSPHVADVYDFGETGSGARFIVMEYVEGESLAARMARERTMPLRALAALAIQILEGLAAAHAAGIVHRDLKPDNVIVTPGDVVKLIDFGVAHASLFADARVTEPGAVLGTPLYMSPEQARGLSDAIDPRSDLYSLGVILYEAIAGAPPLLGDNVNDLLFRIALDEPVPLARRAPHVDLGFAAIVAKAMRKNPRDRFRSAGEMREAIESWRRQAEPAPHARRLGPRARKLLLIPVAAALLLALSIGRHAAATPTADAHHDGVRRACLTNK